MSEFRVEHDTMGEVQVPVEALWQAQTGDGDAWWQALPKSSVFTVLETQQVRPAKSR